MKIIRLYLLYNKAYIIPYVRKSYPNRYYIINYTLITTIPLEFLSSQIPLVEVSALDEILNDCFSVIYSLCSVHREPLFCRCRYTHCYRYWSEFSTRLYRTVSLPCSANCRTNVALFLSQNLHRSIFLYRIIYLNFEVLHRRGGIVVREFTKEEGVCIVHVGQTLQVNGDKFINLKFYKFMSL